MAIKRRCIKSPRQTCTLTEEGIALGIKKELEPITKLFEEQKITNERFNHSLYNEDGADRIRKLEDEQQQAIGRKHFIYMFMASIPLISVIVSVITHFWK